MTSTKTHHRARSWTTSTQSKLSKIISPTPNLTIRNNKRDLTWGGRAILDNTETLQLCPGNNVTQDQHWIFWRSHKATSNFTTRIVCICFWPEKTTIAHIKCYVPDLDRVLTPKQKLTNYGMKPRNPGCKATVNCSNRNVKRTTWRRAWVLERWFVWLWPRLGGDGQSASFTKYRWQKRSWKMSTLWRSKEN